MLINNGINYQMYERNINKLTFFMNFLFSNKTYYSVNAKEYNTIKTNPILFS